MRRQLPGIPDSIPGVPSPGSLPGAFKNAVSLSVRITVSVPKNGLDSFIQIIYFFQIIQGGIPKIPGSDSVPGVPRLTRSAEATGVRSN